MHKRAQQGGVLAQRVLVPDSAAEQALADALVSLDRSGFFDCEVKFVIQIYFHVG